MDLTVNIDNFKDFVNGSWDYDDKQQIHTSFWLKPKNMDVGGGIITIDEIDVLRDYPYLDVITISGLKQDTFEYFIIHYGKQFKAIRFFKNKLVNDWSSLGTLENLEFIYYFFNQRITSLWDMSRNTHLKGIYLNDFSRLKSLNGIQRAINLECFGIGNAVWDKCVIDSFDCFTNTSIKHLFFGGKDIVDKDLSFLSKMDQLEVFDFPTNLYTSQQVAWIVAHFPQLKGYSLMPYREITSYDKNNNPISYILITGKGKRSFKKEGNEEKLKQYLIEFDKLVQRYKSVSYKDAFYD